MKKVGWSIFLIAIFAINTYLLWNYEIFEHIGPAGEGWMQVNQWSLYGIVALIVAAFLIPVILIRTIRRAAALKAFLELYMTTLVALFIARIVLLSVYNSVYGYLHFGGLMLVLGAVISLTAYSYRNISKRRLLDNLPRQLLAWLMAAFIGSILLGWLTIMVVNGWDIQGPWYYLLKSGLLYFWLTIFLGLVGVRLALYRWRVPRMRNNDILDDIAELQKPED